MGPLITQRNATIFFAASIFWAIFSASLNHAHWVDMVSAAMDAGTAVLGYLGFNKTPAGNTVPDNVAAFVDRKANIAAAEGPK